MQNKDVATSRKREMALKQVKSFKGKRAIIYSACAVISALSIVAIIWLIVAVFTKPTLDENFFVSNDTKTTISLTPTDSESSATSHRRTYIVYNYDGDNVSSMKTYFEYSDANAARAAYEYVKTQPEFVGAELDGKYIIVAADESQYKGLTVSDIHQQAEALNEYMNSQSSSVDTSYDDEPQDEGEESTNE